MNAAKNIISELLSGKKSKRVGFYDIIWDDTLEKWKQQGFPKDADPVDYFGFDMGLCGGWFDWKAKVGFQQVLEENSDWQIVEDGNGAILKKWKNKSGTPEHIDFKMTSRQIWEQDYKPLLLALNPNRCNIQAAKEGIEIRKKQNCWSFYGHLFVFEALRQSLGDLTFYMSLASDPDWIHDFCRTYTDFYKIHFQYLFEQAGIPDGIWLYEDMGYKNSLFCSPKMLSELIFPYHKEMVNFFHSYGLPVVLHSCGYIEQIVDLIIDTGFSALHPMEVKAGNNPLHIAEKYGEKLCLIGGLNESVLESGDRSLIKKEISDLINGMKQRNARYIYASDHSISTNVDLQDFLYAIEIYKENMWC